MDGDESSNMQKRPFDPRAVLQSVTTLAAELAESPNFEWTADHHLAIMPPIPTPAIVPPRMLFTAMGDPQPLSSTSLSCWTGGTTAALY